MIGIDVYYDVMYARSYFYVGISGDYLCGKTALKISFEIIILYALISFHSDYYCCLLCMILYKAYIFSVRIFPNGSSYLFTIVYIVENLLMLGNLTCILSI